jgi:uncharacterized protein (DUF1800 family)
MLDENVYVAGTRFGLGLRPSDIDRIGGSPEQWLVGQIRSPQVTDKAFSSLPSPSANFAYIMNAKRKLKEQGDSNENSDARKMLHRQQRDFFINELRARVRLAMATDTPFYERLVDFWSNHFTVSTKKGEVAPLAGGYERTAIRPFVMGRFADMLLAVAHNPAMLVYLDNFQSIGPDSVAGQRRGKGLNENLAREIMELHTLGVNGGYTQGDVTTFAKVITGWGISRLDSDNPGVFEFSDRRHEPGGQTILGRSYPDDGEAQGVAVLGDLAAHPSTALHIATKLARHFIADEPPQEAVNALAKVFYETHGHLPDVYEMLIRLPAAWDVRANPKIKSGYDLVISAARACDRTEDDYVDYCLQALQFLGDIPFSANSPAGMPDTARDLAGPEAMIRRVEWAQMAANKLEPAQPVASLADTAVGPMLSDATHSAISGARNPHEAVAILFGSPEFQRR